MGFFFQSWLKDKYVEKYQEILYSEILKGSRTNTHDSLLLSKFLSNQGFKNIFVNEAPTGKVEKLNDFIRIKEQNINIENDSDGEYSTSLITFLVGSTQIAKARKTAESIHQNFYGFQSQNKYIVGSHQFNMKYERVQSAPEYLDLITTDFIATLLKSKLVIK